MGDNKRLKGGNEIQRSNAEQRTAAHSSTNGNKRETAVIRQSQGRRAVRRLFNAVRSGYKAITSDYRAAMS